MRSQYLVLLAFAARGLTQFRQMYLYVLGIGEGMYLRKTVLSSCMAAILAASLAIRSYAGTPLPAQAQTSTLNGRVTDSLGSALRDAEVSLVPVTPAMPGMKMA